MYKINLENMLEGTTILIMQLTFRDTYLNMFDIYVIVHMQL